jgi:hypothetical protein
VRVHSGCRRLQFEFWTTERGHLDAGPLQDRAAACTGADDDVLLCTRVGACSLKSKLRAAVVPVGLASDAGLRPGAEAERQRLLEDRKTRPYLKSPCARERALFRFVEPRRRADRTTRQTPHLPCPGPRMATTVVVKPLWPGGGSEGQTYLQRCTLGSRRA